MAKSNETIQYSSKTNTVKPIHQRAKLYVLLISLLSFILYYQSVNFEYTLDDRVYTFNNEATSGGLDRIGDIFKYGSINFFTLQPANTGTYRPITLLSFALEFEIAGRFDPRISHFINVLLYSLLIFILGFVLIRLFNKKDYNYSLPILILLLFATHPIHIEAVASVKSRDSLLAGFFMVISLLLFDLATTSKNKSPIILSAFSFFLAVLSKEDAITIVAVIFLITIYFDKSKPLLALKRTAPFLLIALVYLFIRYNILDKSENEGLNSILNNIIYATEGSDRLATNLFVWLHYLKLVFIPFPLSWDYSFNQIQIVTFSNIYPYLSLSVFLTLLIISIKGFKDRNLIGFGILFYFVTFSIYSNLFQSITIGTTLAERFLFIPILGFTISFVSLLKILENRFFPNWPKLFIPGIIFLISIIYSVLTLNQMDMWKNESTLFASGIKTSPNSWRTHAYYATSLRREAIAIMDTNNNLSENEKARNLLRVSASELEKSIRIFTPKAKLSAYQITLGDTYLLLNDTTAAIDSYKSALDDNPNSILALNNLALTLYSYKDYENAVKYIERLLLLDTTSHGSLLETLSKCYIQMGDYKRALDALEKSVNFNLNSQKVSVMLRLSQLINDDSKIQYYQQLLNENNL